jgi:hypothetical protein
MLTILGDSHSIGLERLTKDRLDLRGIAMGNGALIRRLITGDRISDEFSGYFEDSDGRIGLLLGNDAYNIICSRIDANQDAGVEFELDRFAESASPKAAILPEAMIREYLKHVLDPIRKLCEITKVDVLVSGPPPTSPEPLIVNSYEKKGITDLWIAPARTRLACWKIQLGLLQEIAADTGAQFIHTPPSSIDENGFLAEAFWHDGCHGNRDYCKLMIDHLVAEVPLRWTSTNGVSHDQL